jgi:hypothetical protein
MQPDPLSPAEQRVWAELPAASRKLLRRGLSPTDLQTLLISLSRTRAAEVTPARIMNRWCEDRFVRPSPHDPRVLARVEAALWEQLPPEFAGVELSPVAPLGTCSAVATTSQNRIVSTVRGTEVLSDPTNALAVEAAIRRRTTNDGGVDLAASHRVVRAQAMDPGYSAHFRLFALVSSRRDSGSARTETVMLIDHLGFWGRALTALLPRRPVRITFTVFDAPTIRDRLVDTVLPALTGRGYECVEDPTRTRAGGYYAGVAIGIHAYDGGTWVELGDGGLTNWTATLLGDRKERCFVSCVATERLATLI